MIAALKEWLAHVKSITGIPLLTRIVMYIFTPLAVIYIMAFGGFDDW